MKAETKITFMVILLITLKIDSWARVVKADRGLEPKDLKAFVPCEN